MSNGQKLLTLSTMTNYQNCQKWQKKDQNVGQVMFSHQSASTGHRSLEGYSLYVKSKGSAVSELVSE